MRNKRTIITNYLPLCQFATERSHRLHLVEDFSFTSWDSSSQNCSTTSICLWALCSPLIHRHSIFQKSVLFLPNPRHASCSIIKHSQEIDYTCRMYYACTHQNTTSDSFSLGPPFSILSGNIYFPSQSPFHQFFWINTSHIQLLKDYG